jgi:hypothetical protein
MLLTYGQDLPPWYMSGTLWAIAAVLVGVVVGIITVWATFRSASPRRRLYVGLSSITPLLDRTGKELEGLEVRHKGSPLRDPYFVTVEIISRGRRDIPRTNFDGPIEIDLSVDVVALLEAQSFAKPLTVPGPMYLTTARGVQVQPALIARNHRLTYSLLVNGEPNLILRCPLENVDVRLALPDSIDVRLEFGMEVAMKTSLLSAVASVFFASVADGPVPFLIIILGTILVGSVVFVSKGRKRLRREGR